MSVPIWGWAAFVAAVLVLLWVDLRFVHRGAHEVSLREAVGWSVGWLALALAFGAGVWIAQGGEAGGEFITGYLVERALSIDNLFVFALLFGYFAVPARLQDKALVWGIVLAIALRGAMIVGGIALLEALHWMIYVFGAFLIATGVRMARHSEQAVHPERNPVLRALRRLVPMTSDYREQQLVVREGGRRLATPLVAVLVAVATTDVVFALDSIPAILAITQVPFIVFSSNVFALLGMRALYFVLAGAMDRFVHLNVGLAVVLVLIGAKMALSDVVHVPIGLSLGLIALVVGGSMLTSLRATQRPAKPRRGARANVPAPPEGRPSASVP